MRRLHSALLPVVFAALSFVAALTRSHWLPRSDLPHDFQSFINTALWVVGGALIVAAAVIYTCHKPSERTRLGKKRDTRQLLTNEPTILEIALECTNGRNAEYGNEPTGPIRTLYFLGGFVDANAVRDLLKPEWNVEILSAEQSLRDVPPDGKLAFTIQHPIERFFSILVPGLTTLDANTAAHDAAVTSSIEYANQVAENLSSRDAAERAAAAEVMAQIGRQIAPLSKYVSETELDNRKRDIVAIISVAQFEMDMSKLRRRVVSQEADRAMHDSSARSKTVGIKQVRQLLTPKAVGNLARYYREEIDLYAACMTMRRSL